MYVINLRIAVSPSEVDGLIEGLAGLDGQAFGIDH
jgi:hypothetical protein